MLQIGSGEEFIDAVRGLGPGDTVELELTQWVVVEDTSVSTEGQVVVYTVDSVLVMDNVEFNAEGFNIVGGCQVEGGSLKGDLGVRSGYVTLEDVECRGASVLVERGVGESVVIGVAGLSVDVVESKGMGMVVRDCIDVDLKVVGDIRDVNIGGCNGCVVDVRGQVTNCTGVLYESKGCFVSVETVSLMPVGYVVKDVVESRVEVGAVILWGSCVVGGGCLGVYVKIGTVAVIGGTYRGFIMDGLGSDKVEVDIGIIRGLPNTSLHLFNGVGRVGECSFVVGEVAGLVYFEYGKVDLRESKVVVVIGEGELIVSGFSGESKYGDCILDSKVRGVNEGIDVRHNGYEVEYFEELGFSRGSGGGNKIGDVVLPDIEGWYLVDGVVTLLYAGGDEEGIGVYVIMSGGVYEIMGGDSEISVVLDGGVRETVGLGEARNEGLMVVTPWGVKEIITQRR